MTIPVNIKVDSIKSTLQASQDHVILRYKEDIFQFFGFCCGIEVDMCPNYCRKFIDKTVNHERRFIDDIYHYNINKDTWDILGNTKIINRQSANGIIRKEYIYVLGGYSYLPLSTSELKQLKILPSKKKIHTYNNGLCYKIFNGKPKLIKDFEIPIPITNMGILYDKKKDYLYIIGGAYYNNKSFNDDFVPYTYKCNLGNMISRYSFSNDIILKEESTSPDLEKIPGTSRFNPLCFIRNRHIYLLTGITAKIDQMNPNGYIEKLLCNVIDCWKYNINENKWYELKNFPIPLVNQGYAIYKKKYVIMVGGVSYNKTYSYKHGYIDVTDQHYTFLQGKFPFNNISTIEHKYLDSSNEKNASTYNRYFSNIIMVYDIDNDQYYLSDTVLPINISYPSVNIKDDTMYIIGGEGNPEIIDGIYHGNHLSCMIKLKLELNHDKKISFTLEKSENFNQTPLEEDNSTSLEDNN